MRPSLTDTWRNLTFDKIDEGQDLGLEHVLKRFDISTYASCTLLASFVMVVVFACITADKAIAKQDYMLDTRNIRTTYIHSVNTLVASQSNLESRSKFNFNRHKWWLIVVIIMRIVFMFVYTFSFFRLVFVTINQSSFDVLKQYNDFAHQRDSQLANISSMIEQHYYS